MRTLRYWQVYAETGRYIPLQQGNMKQSSGRGKETAYDETKRWKEAGRGKLQLPKTGCQDRGILQNDVGWEMTISL
jgi:hypothetical protein